MRLTAEQLDSIQRAALPLAPDRREAFAADVATALHDIREIGPGNLHRVIVDVQRRHFDPPKFATALSTPRVG